MLERIMNRQKEAVKIFLETKGAFNPRAILIWDDYSGKDIRFNNKLAEYYWTGRHYAALNFFCAQVSLFFYSFLFQYEFQ